MDEQQQVIAQIVNNLPQCTVILDDFSVQFLVCPSLHTKLLVSSDA